MRNEMQKQIPPCAWAAARRKERSTKQRRPSAARGSFMAADGLLPRVVLMRASRKPRRFIDIYSSRPHNGVQVFTTIRAGYKTSTVIKKSSWRPQVSINNSIMHCGFGKKRYVTITTALPIYDPIYENRSIVALYLTLTSYLDNHYFTPRKRNVT
jgi:hypothetical protein